MWAIEHYWLAGDFDQATAGNTATVTQPPPALGGSGTVRIVGTGEVTAPPPVITASGSVAGGIMPGPGVGGVPVLVTFEPRPRPRRITGTAAVVAPAPIIRAVGTVGVSAAEQDLEDLWLLGVLDDETFILLLDDLAA